MKTPISYYGGKQSMLKDILPLVPEHDIYTEVFAGGAALLFSKSPVRVNVINDLNGWSTFTVPPWRTSTPCASRCCARPTAANNTTWPGSSTGIRTTSVRSSGLGPYERLAGWDSQACFRLLFRIPGLRGKALPESSQPKNAFFPNSRNYSKNAPSSRTTP